MSTGTTLAAGALLNTLAFLASNLRGVFTFLVARLLGSHALGTFGVAWAVADLASKFATLGLDYSVVPLVARHEVAGDHAASRRLWRTATRLTLGAGMVVALVASAAVTLAAPGFGIAPDLASAAALMMLAVPGVALYRVSNGLSRGLHVMVHDLYSRGLTESLGTTLAFLAAVALGAGERAPVAAAIVGTTASGVVAFVLARRLYDSRVVVHAPAAPRPTVETLPALGLLTTSLPTALHDLLTIAVMRLDVVMLGLFVGRAPDVTLETVGIYAACVEVGGGLRKVSQAFTPALTPVLARHVAEGRAREVEESYGYVARWMLALLLPAVAVCALSGGTILSLFGPAFRRGAVWLALVASACAVNAFVSLGETLLLIQRPRWNAFNATVALVLAATLNLVLIPRLGPLGAAVGLLAAYGVQGALRGMQLTWWLGWRLPWMAVGRPWVAALAAAPAALAVRFVGHGAAAEAAAGAVYLLGYLAAWKVIGLAPEDRAVWRAVLRRPRPAAGVRA